VDGDTHPATSLLWTCHEFGLESPTARVDVPSSVLNRACDSGIRGDVSFAVYSVDHPRTHP